MIMYTLRCRPGTTVPGSLYPAMMKMGLAVFVILVLFPSLMYSQDFLIEQECERTYANGTKEYLACMGTSEPLFLLQVEPQVEPESSTCGLEDILDRSIYCTLDFNFRCSICNVSNETLAHPPEYVYDPQPSLEDGTWWQSISWYDYPLPLEINFTVSLNHTYKLHSDIIITFQSGRPQAMVLEKSFDYGLSWDAYQYFARDCSVFNMTASAVNQLNDPTEIICIEEYSNPLPHSGGIVKFDVSTRYSLLSASRSPEVIIQAMESNSAFLQFLSITDLRMRLLYPATDGLELSGQEQNLVKYYYAISDLDVFLTCDCNLHSEFCRETSEGVSCDCQHNTMGKNCEQCLPLYNNRPWQKGSQVPYPTGSANECQKCICNEHAVSCTYNTTLGFGVCDDCVHNTAGSFCHLCIGGFYPNMSVSIEDENRCVDCTCDLIGTLENVTECAQVAVDNNPVGQCSCKINVTGRACDRCIDGYYGLSFGACKACGCESLGTINGSISCDQDNGACRCKSTVTGNKCDQCKDEFFHFPDDIDEECLPCGCDPGGSRSMICNKMSGNCECRNHLLGSECRTVQSNYFVPLMDFINFDAWSAFSSCLPEVDPSRQDFTGQGYLKCSASDVIIFNNITIATSNEFSWNYRPVIRYSYNGSMPWSTIRLTVRVSHNTTEFTNNTHCAHHSGEVIYSTKDVTFEPGTGQAWIGVVNQTLSLMPACVYEAQLNLSSLTDEPLFVDSLLMLPIPNDFQVFQQANGEEQVRLEACQMNVASLQTKDLTYSQECTAFGTSLMAELFDGAIACDCNTIGSVFEYCRQGGECICKPGVGGSRCNYCLPGYYNFGPDGCIACNCNSSFSISAACDYITGQCLCKTGAAKANEMNILNLNNDLQCKSCLVNHYPLNDLEGCAPCNCSSEGSTDMQCDLHGSCNCKGTIGGTKCDQCLPGFYGFSSEGCSSCDCNVIGSTSEVCNPVDGFCDCKTNVIGSKCDQCAAGTFNLVEDNPKGCQECFCFHHSSECDSASNYVKSEITSDFRTGSLDGWTSSDPASVNINQNNIRVSHPPNLPEAEFIYLRSPQKFLGARLSTYGLSIIVNLKLDTGIASHSDAPFLRVTGGRANQVVLFSGEAVTPSRQATSFRVKLFEDFWSLEGEARNPSSDELHEILSSVSRIEVRASFGVDTVTTIYFITMETAEYQNIFQLGDQPILSVEECVCNTNTTGLSCESCAPGTFRSNLTGNPYDGCSPCDCHGRGQLCHPDTGICLDCQPGTTGDHCDSCASNVQDPTCDRCLPDHFGFGTDLFNGGCADCACNISGTIEEQTHCNNTDGQCPCKANYGGRQCDDCSLNYYNYGAGCLRCDACYNSVLDLFLVRSSRADAFQGQVGSLQFSDFSAVSFLSRYEHTNEQFLLLVAEANSVDEELSNLEASVFRLNQTISVIMEQLESTIRDMVNAISLNQTKTQDHVIILENTVINITMNLQSAYSMLQSGDLEAANDKLRGLASELSAWEDQLNITSEDTLSSVLLLYQQVDEIRNLTEEAVTLSAVALQTVLAAHAVHDYVTSHLASTLADASSTNMDIETVQQRVTDLLQSAMLMVQTVQNTVVSVSQQNLTSLEERLDIIHTRLSETVTSANDLSRQVDSSSVSLNSLGNVVNNVGNSTSILTQESNILINNIEELVRRTEIANQRVDDTVRSSNQIFATAEEQLKVVQDFHNISSDAQTKAADAFSNVGEISTEAGNVYSLALQQRVELQDPSSDAATALTNASEANQRVEDHKMDILNLTSEAEALQGEYLVCFNESDIKSEEVKNINETTLQVIKRNCTMHQKDIQSLEMMGTANMNLAEEIVEESMNLLEEINNLENEIININQLNIDQLDGLRTRLSNISRDLTDAQYQDVYRLLKTAVEEQASWITSTTTEVEDMKSQINALESFRVN